MSIVMAWSRVAARIRRIPSNYRTMIYLEVTLIPALRDWIKTAHQTADMAGRGKR
ncbi:MAG: hypothetical protein ACXV3U_07650 [Halobacteriota archaeon]